MNEKDAHYIVDCIIDSCINSKDENEMKASYEWKKLDIEHKIRTLGIIAYWSGNNSFISLFNGISKLEECLKEE